MTPRLAESADMEIRNGGRMSERQINRDIANAKSIITIATAAIAFFVWSAFMMYMIPQVARNIFITDVFVLMVALISIYILIKRKPGEIKNTEEK